MEKRIYMDRFERKGGWWLVRQVIYGRKDMRWKDFIKKAERKRKRIFSRFSENLRRNRYRKEKKSKKSILFLTFSLLFTGKKQKMRYLYVYDL